MQRLSLTAQILLASIAGVFLGLFLGDICGVLEPAAIFFVKVWEMMVIPTIVVSIILSIGSLRPLEARNIAIKVGLVLLMFWIIGILLFFSMRLAFPKSEHASVFSASELLHGDEVNLMEMFVPYNPFHSLSEGLIPAIVIFCILIGFALMVEKENGPLMSLLTVLSSIFIRITHWLEMTFPLGIFILTAELAGTISLENLLMLQVFILSLISISLLLCLVVLPLLINCFTGIGYKEILAASASSVVLGFSTGVTYITLPYIAEGVSRLFRDRANEQRIESYSKVIVPIAFVFPLLGAFVPLLFIQFVSWFYKVQLDIWDNAQLIFVGIPYFFSPYDAVEVLLKLMRLPSDSINMYINIFVLRQAFATALSCMSIFSFTAIALAILSGSHRLQLKKALFSLILVVSILLALLAGLKLGLGHLVANTYQGGDIIANMELPKDMNGKLPDELVKTSVYLSEPKSSPDQRNASIDEDILSIIKHRNLLRVGYNPNCIPFAFFNKNGNLVGYDIEMAYDLAKFMNVSQIEFIPVTGDTLASSLNSSACDIIMSSIIVNPERLRNLAFSDSYINAHLAFVVKDERKKDFTKLEDVRKMDKLKIAVLNSTALVQVASNLFPDATLVKIDNLEDYFDDKSADALITTAEEGYAMTLLHPFYSVSIFEPSNAYQVLYAYPVKKENSQSFILSLNYWLKMQDKYGGLSGKYDYWVLGKRSDEAKPRWSIARNILHWVK